MKAGDKVVITDCDIDDRTYGFDLILQVGTELEVRNTANEDSMIFANPPEYWGEVPAQKGLLGIWVNINNFVTVSSDTPLEVKAGDEVIVLNCSEYVREFGDDRVLSPGHILTVSRNSIITANTPFIKVKSPAGWPREEIWVIINALRLITSKPTGPPQHKCTCTTHQLVWVGCICGGL